MTQGGGSLLHKPFSKKQFLAVGSAVDSSNPLAMSGRAKMYSVDETEEEEVQERARAEEEVQEHTREEEEVLGAPEICKMQILNCVIRCS